MLDDDLPGPGGARLLIVDDEASHVRALCDALATEGYETTGCASGAEALEALRRGRFDLLLTDLRMPNMDGIALLKAALAIDDALIGIVMTGEGSIATAVQAMQSGALDYILKPFRLSAALPVLARALKLGALRRENAALQSQLLHKVRELEAANSDLDAFSFSVSHDLRAPLMVIDGCSHMLLSMHAAQLDERGRHLLARIRAGTAQMNELIEGMLRLSSVGRQALKRAEVDVGALVDAVLLDLRNEGLLREGAASVVPPLPPAYADPALLRQVLRNLLGNACKFTARVAAPEISVGCTPVPEGNVYWVRDNGAGFDPAHAQRLFEPFQRMHRSSEFEGIGIGLSIVHRAVRRHGGRLWAEGRVGEGACFFFTLPAPLPGA